MTVDNTTGDLSDFTLVSGSDMNFPCSRVLLAARSEFFRAMLCHDSQKREFRLEKGYGNKAIQILLGWVYTGHAAVQSDKVVQ